MVALSGIPRYCPNLGCIIPRLTSRLLRYKVLLITVSFMTVFFRTCSGIKYIPEVSKDITKSREWRDTKAENKETTWFMENIKSKKFNCRAQIADFKSSVLSSIEEQKQRVVEAFDQLKARAEVEMGEFYEAKLSKIASQIRVCEEAKVSLQVSRELMEAEDQSDSDKFLNMKQSQRQLRQLKGELPEDIAETPTNLDICMNPGLRETVKKLMSALESQLCTHIPSYKYSVGERRSIDVRMAGEKECHIIDLCALANGHFLLSDNNNRKLKELDDQFSVIGQVSVSAPPRGLCLLDEETVIVALSNKSLIFVSKQNQLKVTKTTELNHECHGIAHHDDKLYITDGAKTLYVYCLACSPADSFDMYVNYFKSFHAAKFVTVSSDGKTLYVSDGSHGVVAVDCEGQQLWTLDHPQLDCARGICQDDRGTVLVSGFLSNNLLQLDQDTGDMVTAVAGHGDGLDRPVAVRVYKSSLLVTNDASGSRDSIDIYKLKLDTR